MKHPLKKAYNVTSPYGVRIHPITKKKKKHEGADFGAPAGDPIFAIAPGRVIESRLSTAPGGGYGEYVKIQHAGFKTTSAHMTSGTRAVEVGDYVREGSVIGKVGSTGASTAPHLHFEVIKGGSSVDPVAFLAANKADYPTVAEAPKVTKKAAAKAEPKVVEEPADNVAEVTLDEKIHDKAE